MLITIQFLTPDQLYTIQYIMLDEPTILIFLMGFILLVIAAFISYNLEMRAVMDTIINTSGGTRTLLSEKKYNGGSDTSRSNYTRPTTPDRSNYTRPTTPDRSNYTRPTTPDRSNYTRSTAPSRSNYTRPTMPLHTHHYMFPANRTF